MTCCGCNKSRPSPIKYLDREGLPIIRMICLNCGSLWTRIIIGRVPD